MSTHCLGYFSAFGLSHVFPSLYPTYQFIVNLDVFRRKLTRIHWILKYLGVYITKYKYFHVRFCFESNAQFLSAHVVIFDRCICLHKTGLYHESESCLHHRGFFHSPSNQCHPPRAPSNSVGVCFLYRTVQVVLRIDLGSVLRHVLFVFGHCHLRSCV